MRLQLRRMQRTTRVLVRRLTRAKEALMGMATRNPLQMSLTRVMRMQAQRKVKPDERRHQPRRLCMPDTCVFPEAFKATRICLGIQGGELGVGGVHCGVCDIWIVLINCHAMHHIFNSDACD